MIPEKWKVARFRSNAAVLNAWNNNHPLHSEQSRANANAAGSEINDKCPDFFYPDRAHDGMRTREGYTEISFEDFMKYCHDYSYLNKTTNYEIY